MLFRDLKPHFISALILSGCWIAKTEAREIFVAPAGKPTGTGSREIPLDLKTALSAGSPANPGDTIWLLGGTYRGKFTSDLKGRSDAPITIRSFPGQWAKIDSGRSTDRNNILQIRGPWTVFRDFELMSSDAKRQTGISGSHPEDIPRGEGIHLRAPNTKLINLVVRDAALGIAAWAEAPDSEVYGCLIYDNGWQGPDRAHGHGIYSQNRTGMKLFKDNIIFNQFDKGIQVYGSSSAHLKNYVIEGNTIFNNGVISSDGGLSENIIMYGGETGPEGIVIQHNLFYGTAFDGKLVLGGTGAKDLVFQNNYIPQSVRICEWKKAVVIRNTWVRDEKLIELHIPDDLPSTSYQWDDNAYYFQPSHGDDPPFELRRLLSGGRLHDSALFFHAWRAATQFDRNSRYSRHKPSGKVFVRPNQYEKGRAHITVYNWEQLPAVAVDLSEVLVVGQPYEIVNAQDYFGDPVAGGVYDGKRVELRMTGLRSAIPAGLPAPPPTGPEFNVFVVRPK